MIYFFSVIRSILGSIIVLISILIYGLISIFFCHLLRGWRSAPTFFTVSWCRFVLFIFGIKVKVTGRENIPDTPCLFVFNHTSLLDIPILNAPLTNHIRFGAKSSLFKIPVFGQTLAAFQTIKIARGNREQVIKEYKKSLVRVKEQAVSIILAAEGTRNSKPPEFMPFKSGPFILAIQGQLPVVPLVIENAYKILPRKTYFMPFGPWTRPAALKILKPISTDGLVFEDRTELKLKARAAMEAAADYSKN